MAVKRLTSLFGIIAFAVMFVFVLAGCGEPKSENKVINIADIQGVTSPVHGRTPVTAITETAQYRGTVTWSYNPVTFASNIQYTATINLTPKSGYTLQGVAENFFTVKGATSVSNDANSGIITAVFPSGCSITIDMFDSGGDGWDRAALKIEINGKVLSSNVTIINGFTSSYTFNVTDGDSVKVYWMRGDYDAECSFIMYYTDKPPTPAFTASNNSVWSGNNALLYRLSAKINNASGSLLGSFTVKGNSIIDIAAIKGVTIPAIAGVPVKTITDNAQYTGTVTWNGNPSIFAGSTVYTATITLTPKPGSTMQGVAANFFTVAGATSVSNAANSGVVTAVFPTTATIAVSISINAPVKDAIPNTTASSNTESESNFSISSVSWSPSHNPFHGGTAYTASVTLTANSGYTFYGISSSKINGQDAIVSNNAGSSVKLSYTFPKTAPKTVTGMAIKTQPTKLTYTHGETLNLTGLVVTLTYEDKTTGDVTAAEFAAENVTATPAHGNNLFYSIHNGHPVKITYGSFTVNTNNLTVNRATPIAADFNVSGTGTFNYNGYSRSVTITPKDGKSDGSITVKYNGSTTEPSAAGAYTVTFDVAGATDFNAASGLSAGTLTIDKITPIAADFNVSGTGTFAYDGSSKIVTITPEAGKSNGNITVKYNGNTTAPSAVGTYTVTFDVATSGNFNAASNFSAGTLRIVDGIFNSIDSLKTFLQGKPDNTAATPYIVVLNVNEIYGIGEALRDVSSNKYVNLDLSGSTFTRIVLGLFWYYSYGPDNPISQITNITIPNSITSIENSAFRGFTNLTAINVDSGNANYSSEQGVLYNKNKSTLINYPAGKTGTTFTIPNSVTSIEDYAFYECDSLTSINVDSGNANYSSDQGVLYNKNKTTLVKYPEGKTGTTFTIPNSVTSIGNFAFYNCSSLASVTIPNGVTSIGDYAFYNCSSLASVTIPNGVTSIGDYTFYNCSSLASVTIPNGVTSIGNVAFYNCSSLTSVTIPNGVTYIQLGTFEYCSSLASVTIPNSVISIWDRAFDRCALTSVTIPNSVISIGRDAFNVYSLTSVKFEGTIRSSNFDSGAFPWPGDLRDKFYATNSTNGTPGTYTTTNPGYNAVWTKQ